MTDKKEHIRHSMKSTAPADCVTEIRIGNSVLVVSGFFKQSATETAADKMAKVLEAEAATKWGHGKAVMPGNMTAEWIS